MSLEVRRDVKKGDEIFIFYGKHFFDANNRICECFTCELLGAGYFSTTPTTNTANPLDVPANEATSSALLLTTTSSGKVP